MRPEHCDGNHEDMGCGCFCLKCNAVWDYERRLRDLAGFARVLFYVCKAMGPPIRARRKGGEYRRQPWRLLNDDRRDRLMAELASWWAWFDAAQTWVQP